MMEGRCIPEQSFMMEEGAAVPSSEMEDSVAVKSNEIEYDLAVQNSEVEDGTSEQSQAHLDHRGNAQYEEVPTYHNSPSGERNIIDAYGDVNEQYNEYSQQSTKALADQNKGYDDLKAENDKLKMELDRLRETRASNMESVAMDQSAVIRSMQETQKEFLAQSQRELEARMLTIMEKVVVQEQSVREPSLVHTTIPNKKKRRKRPRRRGKKSGESVSLEDSKREYEWIDQKSTSPSVKNDLNLSPSAASTVDNTDRALTDDGAALALSQREVSSPMNAEESTQLETYESATSNDFSNTQKIEGSGNSHIFENPFSVEGIKGKDNPAIDYVTGGTFMKSSATSMPPENYQEQR